MGSEMCIRDRDKTVLQLVTNPVVTKAAGIEDVSSYRFVLAKSTFTSNYFNDHKVDGIGDSLMSQLDRYNPKGYGLANGKIGGTEYLLMLVKDPTRNSENM